jgi:hypothetical protein
VVCALERPVNYFWILFNFFRTSKIFDEPCGVFYFFSREAGRYVEGLEEGEGGGSRG